MMGRIDPEGHEIAALFGLVDLGRKRILEIGSGDGRLTWRFARRAGEGVEVATRKRVHISLLGPVK